jgi:AraC-like DNA-binding protein
MQKEAPNDLAPLITAVIEYADREGAGTEPWPTVINGLNLVRSRQPTILEPCCYQPIFCLVLQGAKKACFGDAVVTFSAGQSLIVSHDVLLNSRIVEASPAAPYAALALALDTALLRELAREIRTDVPSPDGSGRTIAAGRTPPEIEDAMARLFALTDKPEAAAILAPLIKREIHYWLLTAEHGSMVRLLARSESHASRIAEAIALIRRDITAPLKVAALADAAGMSPSSFHAHFKAITQMAPLQFQKQLRLLEARRLVYGGALSVSETAFAVGYESPTQFSRDYSRRFGVSPSRDAAPATLTTPTTIAAE